MLAFYIRRSFFTLKHVASDTSLFTCSMRNMRVEDNGLECFDVALASDINVTVWPNSKYRERKFVSKLPAGQTWPMVRVQDLPQCLVLYFTTILPFDQQPSDPSSPNVVVRACIPK